MSLVERSWPEATDDDVVYQAFVASPLADADIALDTQTLVACDRAAAALSQIGARSPVAWEPVGRLLLQSEGLASSDIEGIRVTPRRLLQAQMATTDDEPALWVLDNIAAVEAAHDDAGRELSVEMLLAWHEILMRRSPLPVRYVGWFREEQGWIGGMSPPTAVFVPAPPEFIADLMEDLVAFANRRGLSPVAQAAILHAQFETIHPFADGNGRVGRALVGWCLRRRNVLSSAVPPLSPVIASQTDRYVHGLWAYRKGRHDDWVTWFCEVSILAAAGVDDLTARIAGLLEVWRARLSDRRADDTSRRLIEVLPDVPVIDVAGVVSTLGVSDRSARSALKTLEDRDVLEVLPPTRDGPGRPRKQWVAGALVDLL